MDLCKWAPKSLKLPPHCVLCSGLAQTHSALETVDEGEAGRDLVQLFMTNPRTWHAWHGSSQSLHVAILQELQPFLHGMPRPHLSLGKETGHWFWPLSVLPGGSLTWKGVRALSLL